MFAAKKSPYMTWAKYHAGARYNLANSGILGCQNSDLELTMADILVNGPNHEGYAPLKEAIASKYGVKPEQVVPSQGTSMANFLAMATLVERGDEVLIEQPAYDPFIAAAAYLGAEVKRFSRTFENGFQIDPEEIRGKLTDRTRLIVISDPHNPSGVTLERERLNEIGRIAQEKGVAVLVDEVYRDISDEPMPLAATLGDHFITTSSLTKAYGLSGLRCGWIISNAGFAERARRMNDLFGAVGSVPSDTLAVAAFRQLDRLMERTRSILGPNQKLIREFLGKYGDYLDVVLPSQSMIVFPRLRQLSTSDGLHDRLRDFETSIVPGRFFEDARHFRLGFAVMPEDVSKGLEFLGQVLEEAHQK